MGAYNNHRTFVATGNINPARFVKMSGDFSVAQAGASDSPVGVSFDIARNATATLAAVSGEGIGVYTEGAECWLQAGDTVTAGQLLIPDASGQGVPVSGYVSLGAIALEGGASGELIRVQVRIESADAT